MPGTTLLTYALTPVTAPPASSFTIVAGVLMFSAFVVAALCEELGWSGYLLDLMQARSHALVAAMLLGLLWAIWHWVPLLEANRTPPWIGWWTLYTIALRVLMVWVYNNTGRSVFAAALFHAMANVSAITFAPYYDPRRSGLIVVSAAAIVATLWGPRTLARFRWA